MIPGGEPRLQARVGAIAWLVILAGAVFVVVIWPRLGGGGVPIDVRFDHVAALQEGAPVMQAGRRIGRVESIRLDGDSDRDGDHTGAVVRLRLARRHLGGVASNAELFVSSKGVMSPRYLEIGPPPDGAPPGPPIEPGMPPLRGVEPPSLDRALQRTWDNLQRSRAFAEAVAPEARALVAAIERLSVTLGEVEPAPGAYATLGLRFGALAGSARALLDELEAADADPERLRGLADRARGLIADARAAVATLQRATAPLMAEVDRVRGGAGAGAGARLALALAEGERALAAADRLLLSARALGELIERGEGSAIRLSRDPEFPEDAKELGRLLKRNPWRIVGRPPDGAPPAHVPPP